MKRTPVLLTVLALITLAGSLAAHMPPTDRARAAVAEAESTASAPAAPVVKTSGLYTNKITNNTLNEIESAVTALSVNGVDRTVGAFIRENNGVFRVLTATTATPNTTNLSQWTRRTPSLPAGHDESVDPVLDVNPYDSGVGPERTYLGGLTYNLGGSSGTTRTLPEAITVWRSDDAGNSWTAPTIVESHTAASQGSLDKPDIAVSWYPSTRGYVYVAYANVLQRSGPSDPFRSELIVERSTNGGVSFTSKKIIASGAFYQAPQIVVSSRTGKVYVIYMDYTNDRIRMSSSLPTNFNTWTTENVVNQTGRLLEPGETIPGDASCPVGIQAVSVPHARYNWVKDQIGLVWHARQTSSPSSRTDVYFSARTATGWTTVKRVNPTATNDQWYPALDYDNTGNYVVVFYDRSQDTNNLLYRQAWARLDGNGNRLSSGFVAGVFDSDPTEVYISTNSSGQPQLCFKGEYQDIWYWPYSDAQGGRFHAVWSGHPSTKSNDDVYISAIQ